MQAVQEDPNILFRAPYWPAESLVFVRVFMDAIDSSKISEEAVRTAPQGFTRMLKIPVIMHLLPPGEFWSKEDGLQYLSSLSLPGLKKVLEEIGVDYLRQEKKLLWSSILAMPPGSESQRSMLDFLLQHRDCVVAEKLRTYSLFTQDSTRSQALKLLMDFPYGETLQFLKSLPPHQDIMEARAKIRALAEQSDGYLTFSTSEVKGGISES
jgi:hypothetical protein